MRFSESEIVEDVLEHMRQAGGEFREWRAGTANGIQGGRFKIQDERVGRFKIADESGDCLSRGKGVKGEKGSGAFYSWFGSRQAFPDASKKGCNDAIQ